MHENLVLNKELAIETSSVRDVFVGSHSKVWQALSKHVVVAQRKPVAISHHAVGGFDFSALDRVWVLAYSRQPSENAALLKRIHGAGVHEVVYVSSASTIVGRLTQCYQYPRVKHSAEFDVLALPSAKILTLGLMYEELSQLPGGTNAATAYVDLAAFVAAPHWPEQDGRRKHLVSMVARPFGGPAERLAYLGYGHLLRWVGSHPCWLRPVDFVLRALGVRWYGYVYLTNKLWNSTTS